MKNYSSVREYITDRSAPLGKYTRDLSLGLSDSEIKKYSLMNLCRALHTKKYDSAGFEFEVSDAYAKKSGRSPMGAYIPLEVMTRDLTKGSAAAGGNLIGTEHKADLFIDLLRPKNMCIQLGARVMSGLVGDVAIPSHTAATLGYWITEGADITTEGAPTFGIQTMAPKTVGAYVDMSRKMLLQSTPAIERLVIDDMKSTLSSALDAAIIAGASASNQPTGILNTAGIGSVTSSGSLSWADMVNLETEVAIHNADAEGCGYLAHPIARSQLLTTMINTTYGERPLMGPSVKPGSHGQVNGYPIFFSSNVPTTIDTNHTALIFGNFKDVIVGIWGAGIDLTVDKTTLGLSGGMRLITMLDCDVIIRHPESFAAVQDIDTV